VSEVQGLPTKYIAMTESGDVTNAIIGKNSETGLMKVVESNEWFESLVISDMPSEAPDE
jgi:hypothetical protein